MVGMLSTYLWHEKKKKVYDILQTKGVQGGKGEVYT
jgi:hypothetical protein